MISEQQDYKTLAERSYWNVIAMQSDQISDKNIHRQFLFQTSTILRYTPGKCLQQQTGPGKGNRQTKIYTYIIN